MDQSDENADETSANRSTTLDKKTWIVVLAFAGGLFVLIALNMN